MWDAEYVRRRLRELARQDPLLQRHGSWSHGYVLGPRLPARRVERFELVYGIELPASYRAFLLEVGDGGAGPFFGMYRHDGSDWDDVHEPLLDHEPGFLASAFPHTGPFRLDPDEDDPDEAGLLCGSLTLAHAGCGSYCRLVVSGPARGRVWAEDLYGPDGLLPGPDLRDWYLEWLSNPPQIDPVSPRLVRLAPGRYDNAGAAGLAGVRKWPTAPPGGPLKRLRRRDRRQR